MTNIDTLKQKIINLVMGMDNEQALEVIDTLEKLSIILYEEACKINGIHIDNQQVVYLNADKNNKQQKFAA